MAEGYIDNPMGVINRYMTWKVVQGTTNANGYLDTGLKTGTDGTIIYAANIDGDNGYVGIPYRIQQVNSDQSIYCVKTTSTFVEPIRNTNVKFVIFILKYDIPQNN